MVMSEYHVTNFIIMNAEGIGALIHCRNASTDQS